MNKIGLAQLIFPLTSEDFFKQYWPHTPLFIPPVQNKLKDLIELPQLQNLEALVAARSLKVRACLPDFDDEYSSISLDPQDALKAFRNNMTLVFDSMQAQEKKIATVLTNIREDLGLVTGGLENNLCRARSIVYATPAGAGTRMHFDANANFIIQLSGTKRWILAENTSVKNPTERFTVGAFEMPAALEKQCHAELLYEMPENANEIIMKPGCVLFVPRGYWHATDTEEDSISLNFTFSQPSWADVFTKSLQEWLLNSPDWRALADGIESKDSQRKNFAIEQFESLIKDLSLKMPEISGRELLIDSGLLKSE